MDQKPESPDASAPFVPRSMGIKVGMLLAFSITVAVALVVYVLFERGTFDDFHRLTLIAHNADGVAPGMDLMVAGYPIGRVRRLSLNKDDTVSIHIRVPVKHAHHLRTTTQFTLLVGLVGGPKLRASTAPAHLGDPPLPDRATRAVGRGDTTEELPGMVAMLREALENVDKLTEPGSNLERSLANLRSVTERMAGKHGVLGGVLGSEDNAKKLLQTIDRASALLATLDGLLSRTDQRLYGAGGIADETQKAVARANVILAEVSASLKKVDAILADAQAAAVNVKAATTDLTALRAEVEASLRKVSALIDEINRKWPFERETKIKLP